MKKIILSFASIFICLSLTFADTPTFVLGVSDDTTTVYTTHIGFNGATVSKSGYKAIVTLPTSSHDPVTLDANVDTLLSLSTQELGLDTQAANTVFAGKATAGTIVPAFRGLVDADIPDNITITETDPIVKALTGIITSDSVVIGSTPDNHTNWDTAYGWGNHASAGYLAVEVDGSITNELPAAGYAIDVAGTTVSVDTSEINSTTFGNNTLASFVHTYDITGTDVTVTFSSNKVTFSGDLQVTGDLYVANVFVTNIDGDSYVSGKLGIGKTDPSYPLDVEGAVVSTAVTTDNVTISTTGVKLTGSNGSLTFLGFGDGQDENLKLDLNTSADTATISSTTGISSIDAGSIIWKGKHSASDYTAGASTTTGGLTFKDGLYTSGSDSQTFSKSFPITNPTASADAIYLWGADANLTITGVHLYCEGAGIVGHLTIESSGVDGATDITGVVNTVVSDDTSLSNPNAIKGQKIGWRTTSATSGVTRVFVTYDGIYT